MTNSSGAIVWNAVWQPWGGAHTLTGAEALNARFPGQWFQLEAGLHYNWHRHYDPSLGRYTQPDPLGFVDGPSVYAYARSAPVSKVDPRGLMSSWPDWLPGGRKQCPPNQCKKMVYRAVMADEYNDIVTTGRFSNPDGIECKYFSKTLAGAQYYAQLAGQSFGEEYKIVGAEADCQLIDSLEEVTVDRKVPAICVPTVLLLHFRVVLLGSN